MKNSDAVRQLKAELTQDYDFIVLNGEKNAIMSARVSISEERDEYLYAALDHDTNEQDGQKQQRFPCTRVDHIIILSLYPIFGPAPRTAQSHQPG